MHPLFRFLIVSSLFAWVIPASGVPLLVTPSASVVAADAESGDALHGDEEHGGDNVLLSLDPGAAIWNLLIFIVVMIFLMKFVWPHILSGLQAREAKIHEDLSGAEQANAEAKRLLAEYEKRLDEAQAETQAMFAEARKDAEAAGQRIVAEAKEEASRQRDRVIAEIETAKKVAINDLANQTTNVALAIAQQVVGRELKPEDHEAIIRRSLDELPSRN